MRRTGAGARRAARRCATLWRMPFRRPPIARALLALLLVALTACAQANAADDDVVEGVEPFTQLTVGLAGAGPSVDGVTRNEALANWLTSRLGVPVRIVTFPDQAAAAAALVAGEIDVTPLGALRYARAELRADVVPTVADQASDTRLPEYRTLIVAPEESELRSLRDVVREGSRFAFGDLNSVAGSVFPRHQLARLGAVCEQSMPCNGLDATLYLGSDLAVVRALLSGVADAGALDEPGLAALEEEGIVEPGELRVLARDTAPSDPWVIRSALGREARAHVVEAMVALDDPELLAALGATRFAEVLPGDYHEVRSVGRLFELLGDDA